MQGNPWKTRSFCEGIALALTPVTITGDTRRLSHPCCNRQIHDLLLSRRGWLPQRLFLDPVVDSQLPSSQNDIYAKRPILGWSTLKLISTQRVKPDTDPVVPTSVDEANCLHLLPDFPWHFRVEGGGPFQLHRIPLSTWRERFSGQNPPPLLTLSPQPKGGRQGSSGI